MDAAYPSDLTDEEWNAIRNLLPPKSPTGRKREIGFRQILDGIFYVTKEGCQ